MTHSASHTRTPRDHIVRFYDNDQLLCDAVGKFLLEGHREKASSIVIATEEHRRDIERCLSEGGLDVSAARKAGRLVLLDAEQTVLSFTIGGMERGVLDPSAFHNLVGSAVRQATAASPTGRVRAYGEMVDFLLRAGNESGTAHVEELWNELRLLCEFQLYCGYRLSHLDRADHRAAFEKICKLHSHVLPSESFDEATTDEERRRKIAALQQRARALETEIQNRQRLEGALREEQEHLRSANRRKDEFLAMLGHELRNPLNPIITSLDLMDMRGDEGSRREREIIRRQAQHLAGLVQDLLDIARVTGGKVMLRKEPTEIAVAIARAIEMASPLLEQRAHLLQLAVPQHGLLVDADPMRLPQVFANLLMNAAKYTERGGRICVSARRDGGEIVVDIRDNGIGIAPEFLSTMFEPFVQGTRALDRAEGGMGLGLALVRSLTQLHGGTVMAQSDGLGRGSTFSVGLPALPESAASRETRPSPEGASEPAASGPVERVLIVDDNADCALGFAEIVRILGHEVEVALDGPRALQIAATFKPTVALVDIGLPVMNGYELARKLRESTPSAQLKLVAVTGYGEEANRAMSLDAGFDLHTVKPVELENIRSLLSQTNGGSGNGSSS
ncbi:MAG TPA: ATP-binding protein [Candidatus Dormibacteraeota bacterium]|nr:ATP-binding protein [Candidatus Dormibacteraeota bacterium]